MSDVLTRDWAGAPRAFRLGWGQTVDLEEAVGKVPIAVLWKRLGGQAYFAKDVAHTIRLGLVGGGMSEAEAHRLVADRVGIQPLVPDAALALDIVTTMMMGLPVVEGDRDAEAEPEVWDAGAWMAAAFRSGIAPEQLRAMRVSDVVAMARAFGKKGPEHLTQEEFAEVLAKHEPEALKGAGLL